MTRHFLPPSPLPTLYTPPPQPSLSSQNQDNSAPNQPALITGASAGIGASTARLFARAGSNVVLVARRADRLAEVKADCEKVGKGKVVVVEADMQDRESLNGIVGKLGGLKVDM